MSTITIEFTSINPEYPLKNYKFLNHSGKIEKDETKVFDIPDKYYGNSKCSIKINFKLYSDDKKQENIFEFDLFYGNNFATCFLEEDGNLFQIIFKQKEGNYLLETQNKKKIKNYDTNNTKNRKRYLLINYAFNRLKINDTKINLNNFLPPNPFQKVYNSINFCIYNLKENLILSNNIEDSENLNYKEYSLKYSSFVNEIIEEFKLCVSSKKDCLMKNLSKKLKNIKSIPGINLNLSKEKLENEISEEKYLNYEINATLVKILKKFYLESKDDIDLIKKLYDYYSSVVGIIERDNSLKIYQKILILNQFSTISGKFNKIDDFINSKFKYYILSKVENGSVLDYVKKFFEKFILNLNEDHKAYDKLVELDNPIGYYKGEMYFCFGMENLHEVKTHIKEKMPEILTTYYNIDDNNCAVSNAYIGLVTINIESLKKFKDIDLTKSLNKDNIKMGKNLAAKVVIYFFHEVTEHIKFAYSNYCKYTSPSRFINELNEEYELVSENNESSNQNLIKILDDNVISDPGTFFELLYGKIDDFYVAQILDYLDDFGKLIDRVDLILDNLKLFNEYIKSHFSAIINEIDINDINDLDNISIEEEIKIINTKIGSKNKDFQIKNEENINKEKKYNNDKDEIIEKKEDEKVGQLTSNLKNDNPNNLKDKRRSRLIYKLFADKCPKIRNMFRNEYRTPPKKLSPKDMIIRDYFLRGTNLQTAVKKIFDDPNMDDETKSQYYDIFNSLHSCD